MIAGPEVSRSGVLISAAMIIASVVLPRPGGPDSRTWSGARSRARAASSTRDSCSRTRSWPMTSARLVGRSAASTARSSPSASPPTTPRLSTYAASAAARAASSALTPCSASAGPPAAGRRRRVRAAASASGATASTAWSASLPDQPSPTRPACTWARQASSAGTAGRGPVRTVAGRHADPVLELEDDPLRALLADARHAGQRRDVPRRDRPAQLVGREHRQHRLGQLGARRRSRSAASRRGSSRRRRGSRTASATPRGRPCWSAASRGCRSAAWPACAGCRPARARLPRPPGPRSRA